MKESQVSFEAQIPFCIMIYLLIIFPQKKLLPAIFAIFILLLPHFIGLYYQTFVPFLFHAYPNFWFTAIRRGNLPFWISGFIFKTLLNYNTNSIAEHSLLRCFQRSLTVKTRYDCILNLLTCLKHLWERHSMKVAIKSYSGDNRLIVLVSDKEH